MLFHMTTYILLFFVPIYINLILSWLIDYFLVLVCIYSTPQNHTCKQDDRKYIFIFKEQTYSATKINSISRRKNKNNNATKTNFHSNYNIRQLNNQHNPSTTLIIMIRATTTVSALVSITARKNVHNNIRLLSSVASSPNNNIVPGNVALINETSHNDIDNIIRTETNDSNTVQIYNITQ